MKIKKEEILDFCLKRELSPIQKVSPEALEKSELRPQEIHFRIEDGKFNILRRHDSQDNIRIEIFFSMLLNCGLNHFPDLNFEGIIYFGDDLTFEEDGAPRFCFTRRKNHKNILLPDPHISKIPSIVGRFAQEDVPFKDKKDSAIFEGSYCGGSDPKENQRFRFCMKNRNSELGHFKITNFFTGQPNGHSKYLEDYDWESIESPFIIPEDQLKHKYILNINGETNCWDRFLWTMASNSLCLYLRPKRGDMSWYYHYLHSFGGFSYVDEIDWEGTVSYFNDNPEIAEELIKKQKEFVEPFLNPATHLKYLRDTLVKYNSIYNGCSS